MMIHRFFQSSSTSFAWTAEWSADFVITLPEKESRDGPDLDFAGKNRRHRACASARHTTMTSILFVSLDGDLRAVVSRVLRRTGWQVTAVAHGGHAMLACAKGQSFDVLVIDDRAHEGTGPALAGQLRRYRPGLQVVSLSDAHASRRDNWITVVRPCTADDVIDAVIQAAATAIASA
jgi:CheY-like chemotaxis protein